MAEKLFDIDFNKIGTNLGTITVDVLPEDEIKLDEEVKKEEGKGATTLLLGNDKTIEVDVHTEEPESLSSKGESQQEEDKGKADHSLAPIVSVLKEEGILLNFDDEAYNKLTDSKEKSAFIIDNFNNTIQDGIDDGLKQYDPLIRDIINKLEHGVNYDEAVGVKLEQTRLKSLTEDNIRDDVKIQENLVRQHYRMTTSFDDKKIEKEIAAKTDSGKLEDDALECYTELGVLYDKIDKQQLAQAKADNDKRAQRQEASIKKLKADIFATKEIIPGMSLNKKDQETLFNYMTVPVRYDDHGNAVSKASDVFQRDPEGSNLKLAYLIHLGIFDKDNPQWDKLVTAKKRDAVEMLSKELEKTKGTNVTGRTSIEHEERGNRKVDVLKGFPG